MYTHHLHNHKVFLLLIHRYLLHRYLLLHLLGQLMLLFDTIVVIWLSRYRFQLPLPAIVHILNLVFIHPVTIHLIIILTHHLITFILLQFLVEIYIHHLKIPLIKVTHQILTRQVVVGTIKFSLMGI